MPVSRRRKRPNKPRTLPAIRPNLGIEAAYKRRLLALVDEMNNSLRYWIEAQWKQTPPMMATDALPVTEIQKQMAELGERWQDRFDVASKQLAEHFAQSAMKRTDSALAKILSDAGISVNFKQTRSVMDVYRAVLAENVGLIKSIASENLSKVEGLVMRSVAEGRNLGPLSKALQEQFGVSRRRAALIARDQNNKASAVITRARQTEMGITKAIWLHSKAGKHPRPEHVAFSAGGLGGPVYDVTKGAFLEGKWTWPGVEINCRCVSLSIIPGLDDDS